MSAKYWDWSIVSKVQTIILDIMNRFRESLKGLEVSWAMLEWLAYEAPSALYQQIFHLIDSAWMATEEAKKMAKKCLRYVGETEIAGLVGNDGRNITAMQWVVVNDGTLHDFVNSIEREYQALPFSEEGVDRVVRHNSSLLTTTGASNLFLTKKKGHDKTSITQVFYEHGRFKMEDKFPDVDVQTWLSKHAHLLFGARSTPVRKT